MDSVLHRVWESQESTLLSDDLAKLLHARLAVSKAVDLFYGAEISLFVWEVQALTYLLTKT